MYVSKGETFYTLWTPSLSGTSPRPTGALPRFVVFNDTIPIYSGSTTHGYGISGVFGVSFPTTGDLFVAGAFYNVSSEATLSGKYYTNVISQFYLGNSRFNAFSGYNDDAYHADFILCRNENLGLDRYAAVFFKNDQMAYPSTASFTVTGISGPNIILNQVMTQVPTGIFYYNASGSFRIGTGEVYTATATALIDGINRRWRIPISRDYNI